MMIAFKEQEHMVKLQIEMGLTSGKAFLPPHTHKLDPTLITHQCRSFQDYRHFV